MKDIPVILVCYNRPWHTLQVLKALEKHNIQNLYIFSDAPKAEIDEDGVLTTRKLIKNIYWTKPKIICQEVNQGLAKSIVAAVNYVFDRHDKLVLLEDDCVPQKYFFEYMEKCLSVYETNNRVFGIHGYSVTVSEHILKNYPYDVYFHPRMGSWGWGTWKHKWKFFCSDLRQAYNEAIKKGLDLTIGGNDIPQMVQQYFAGTLRETWALFWLMSVYLQRGFYVYPVRAHIRNIGTDGTGVHFRGESSKFDSVLSNERPISCPNSININVDLVNHVNSFFGGPKLSENSLRKYIGVEEGKMTRRKINKEGWNNYAKNWGKNRAELKIPSLAPADHKEALYLGDEWSLMNKTVKYSYGINCYSAEEFRDYLQKNLLDPYLPKGDNLSIMEIGPGGGRITESLIPKCQKLYAVDVSEEMLKQLKKRFPYEEKVEYILVDGKSIPGIPPDSLDCMITFDTFVHIEPYEIFNYLNILKSLLREGGIGIVHFSDIETEIGFRKFSADVDGLLVNGTTFGNFSIMSKSIMAKFLRELGFEALVLTNEILPRDAIAVFRKKKP